MRLIDADDLLDYGMRFQFGYNKDGILLVPLCDMTNSIRNAPTVDAEPVRHGRWDDSGRYKFKDGRVAVRCTECGCVLSEDEFKKYAWVYCPICGAKMDGGETNAAD